MSKNLLYIIIFFILLVFFIKGFYISYSSHNINNLAYVLALGIDKGENAKFKVSTQFAKNTTFSESGSSDFSNNVLVSGEADSIFSALNLLNSYIGREINLAHCSVVVFSEDLAKEGLSNEIYSLINNEEIRPSANLLITNCSAYDYLCNTNPNLEKLTTKYFNTFSITSKFTGYFSNITIGDFFYNLAKQSCDSTAIMGGLNNTARSEQKDDSYENSNSNNSSESSESNNSSKDLQNSSDNENVQTNPNNLVAGNSSIVGSRGTENLGLAVFNNNKYCGNLSATETICHLLLINEIDTCIITCNNPFKENDSIEVQITPAKHSKIHSTIDNDTVKINADLTLNANIIDIQENLNFEDLNTLETFSNSIIETIENNFQNYFAKMSKEYNSDIDKFYLSILKYFPTKDDWNNFNWKEKYKTAEFTCNININDISSLLVSRS